MLGRFIASQFRTPSGLLGNAMARGNEPKARWTIDLLNIQPHTRVLEIGFGPGVAIEYTAKRAPQGHVSGIDYSKTMVQIARKRNADATRTGWLISPTVMFVPSPTRMRRLIEY